MEQRNNENRKEKIFYYRDGKLFIRKEVERNLFFILTLMMLLGGILIKLGLL